MPTSYLLSFATCLFFSLAVTAQVYKLKPLPEKAQQLYARKIPRLSPPAYEWARRSAAVWKNKEPDEKKIKQEIRNSYGGLPNDDVSEMCFIVLMEATNDQSKDLRDILGDAQQETQKKQGRRYKVQDSVVLSGKSLKQIAKQRNRDGLGDLTQSEQSRPQEIIELRSKFEEAISRLSKKMSDTNSGIISQIK